MDCCLLVKEEEQPANAGDYQFPEPINETHCNKLFDCLLFTVWAGTMALTIAYLVQRLT